MIYCSYCGPALTLKVSIKEVEQHPFSPDTNNHFYRVRTGQKASDFLSQLVRRIMRPDNYGYDY